MRKTDANLVFDKSYYLKKGELVDLLVLTPNEQILYEKIYILVNNFISSKTGLYTTEFII